MYCDRAVKRKSIRHATKDSLQGHERRNHQKGRYPTHDVTGLPQESSHNTRGHQAREYSPQGVQ